MRTFSPFLRASTASASEGSSFFGRLSGSKGASAAFASWPNGGSYDGNVLSSLLSDSVLRARTSPTVDDMREVIAIREDVCKRSRRVLGGEHPDTQRRQTALRDIRLYLAHHFPEEG